jgi:hypothetical protein
MGYSISCMRRIGRITDKGIDKVIAMDRSFEDLRGEVSGFGGDIQPVPHRPGCDLGAGMQPEFVHNMLHVAY